MHFAGILYIDNLWATIGKEGALVGEESLKPGEAAWISKLVAEEKQRLSK